MLEKSPPTELDTQRLTEIMEMFARYQRRLYLYIRSMLPCAADADEVLQETNIVVWRKFEQFEPGTDFRAWVFQIAYFEVRKHLERKRRQGPTFSDELLEQLATEYHRREEDLEHRGELLAQCVDKLPASDQQLARKVFGQEIPVAALATQSGRKRTSIYRSLRRIRQILLECVERQLQSGANAGGTAS